MTDRLHGAAPRGGAFAQSRVWRASALGMAVNWGVWVLALALLWGQTLGQLHRVVHAQQTVHAASVSVVAEAATATATATATGIDSVWQGLWGEHASLVDCQLFDQACPDALQHAVWTVPVLPLPALGFTAPLYARLALFERFFAARAPPVLR